MKVTPTAVTEPPRKQQPYLQLPCSVLQRSAGKPGIEHHSPLPAKNRSITFVLVGFNARLSGAQLTPGAHSCLSPALWGRPTPRTRRCAAHPCQPLPARSRSPASHGRSLSACSVCAVAPALPAALPALGSASKGHFVCGSVATKSALISS